jgi:hypothetical protein
MSVNYVPGPTGLRLLQSRKFGKIINGPVGGGKSTVALMDLAQRSVLQEPFHNVRRTKHLIVRNTLAQLKSTVKPIIDTWFVTMTHGTMGQWKLTDNTFEVKMRLADGTFVWSEYLMMPADTPEDVKRLLSLEVSSAWIEEGREVDPEVTAGVEGRVNRFPARVAGGCTYPGVVVSTNAPPIGGYWHKQMTAPPSNYEVFTQPPAILDDGSLNPDAENLEHLAPDYYENLVSGKSEEWIDVYLKNKFGQGDSGKPVYRGTFKKAFHVSEKKLLPILQSINPLIVGMDNGLTAAASFMQRDARGRVNLLAEEFVAEGVTMGVESFLDRQVVPRLVRDYANFKRENIIFVVDPACFQRSQVDEKTIAQAIMQRGFKVQRANTNDPERRIQAVESLLALQIDGGAALLIDPECTHTIATMEWGYRWKKAPEGIVSTTVEKNHHSHMGDSVQYGCLHYAGIAALGSWFNPRGALRPVVPVRWAYT